MRDYKKLLVWEKSHQLTLEIYKVLCEFPKEEMFGLISQMKRSSSSIPTNIAEGAGRKGDKEFCRFLYIAYGSANELEYQIILSEDLNYINLETSSLLKLKDEEVKKMLNKLISTLES